MTGIIRMGQLSEKLGYQRGPQLGVHPLGAFKPLCHQSERKGEERFLRTSE